jgi:putative DNA methylase
MRPVLERAREEIRRSWREVCELNQDHPNALTLFDPEHMPLLHDPFAGGGAIPLEAQRLGIEPLASDLNPVAVLINKAMVEIPPRLKDLAPIARDPSKNSLIEAEWSGMQGLASDVRYYGKRVEECVLQERGKLYPQVEITSEMAIERPDLKPLVGKRLKVLAWFWARTVLSPNPAFSNVEVPLVASFSISIKKGKEIWVEPIISGNTYEFKVRVEGSPTIVETVNRKGATCIMSSTPIPFEYVREQGKKGKLGSKLMAIVAESDQGRVYLSPTQDQESIAHSVQPQDYPITALPKKALGFRVQLYGMDEHHKLFTARQLSVITAFSDAIQKCHAQVVEDFLTARPSELEAATKYADAVLTYLACALSRLVTYNNTISFWNIKGGSVAFIFARQAIPMSWDYIEVNPLAKMSGNWAGGIEWVSDVVETLGYSPEGNAIQADAAEQNESSVLRIVSTDPPYYDNIGYADLSDFMYVWLRRTLKPVYPELFATIAVPKTAELVATPFRHDSKAKAEKFFLDGMTFAMQKIQKQSHPAFPITIYYAFKQAETKAGKTSSTGWEVFLDAVLRAGFSLVGTWPMRTERNSGVKRGTNALASSIVLVCRKRDALSRTVSRRQFIRELNEVLPNALDEMTRGVKDDNSPVAPVDLSQAIIGPGMSVFSKYEAVLEADGSPMTVQTALQLINRFLAEDDFDSDTQFCLHWFDDKGWEKGVFGDADVLARAKATSVNGLSEAGVLKSGGGNVQLLKWSDYPADWNPQTDTRIPIWEVLHQLIRALRQSGESSAGKLLGQPNVASRAEAARQLAYRLYTLCERKGWAEDARAYNELITSWPAIESSAPQTIQTELVN